MNEQKPRRVRLECGHELWLKRPVPRKGELCYCFKCADYVNVGPAAHRFVTTYYPDYEWKCSGKRGEGFTGECLVDGCAYTDRERYDWYALRDKMETHHLRAHTKSGLLATMKIVPIPLPKTETEPPF